MSGSHLLAFWLAYLCAALPWISAQQLLTFRIGATVGRDGSCASLYNETFLGYRYFFDWLDRRPPSVVTDASGTAYQLRLSFRLISHNCTEEGRADAMASLINGTPADPTTGAAAQPPVHLLLGGHGDNALEDALQANAASRILLHCCTARDTVFQRGLPHVYGLFTPASLHTGTVLRTMALRGVRRVAVVYSRESPLHVQLCEGALAQLPPLGELRPGFGGVLALNYSAADADSPGFWAATGAQVASADADAVVACDDMNRTSLLVHQLKIAGHRLSALWLASTGNIDEFLQHLDGRGEYALTTVQWMPNLPYADPDFGTASEYAAAFFAATGHRASYYSAGATTGGYVLFKALQQAVSICSLGAIAGEDAADTFMWSAGALSCVDSSHRALDITGQSGTAILRYVLSTLNIDTFFGPIGFNGFHQNMYHPAIVAQVLSGGLIAVLPLDVADTALVMPIPYDPSSPKRWVTTPAGISIVTLLFCLGMVCLALALLTCRRRVAPYLMHSHSVELRMEDIKVDIAPQLNADGSFEPGEGVYRGTRVKLVVANELLAVAPRSQRTLKPADIQGAHSGFFLDDMDISRSVRRQPVAPLRSLTSPLNATTAPEATKIQYSRKSLDVAGSGAVTSGSGGRRTDIAAISRTEGVGSSGPLLLGAGFNQSATHIPSIRTQAAPTYLPLSQRARRQYLALVWRAVRLQHPRMCPVLGIVWEWPGLLPGTGGEGGGGGGGGGGRVPVLVRQWHEFDNLDRLLENETVPLPLLTKAHIAQGVAEGLAYLHAQQPPILAGPLEASRVIMDKHFNPHLFLRLRNLDPEYGRPPDLGRVGKLRAASVFGARPSGLSVAAASAAQKSMSPALARPLMPLPPSQPQAQDPPLKAVGLPVAESETAVLPFTVTGPADEDIPAPTGAAGPLPAPRLQSVSMSLLRTSPPPRVTAATLLSELEPASGAAGFGRSVGLFAPPPQYQPSAAQDLYEFGLLLCRIFIVASPEDSGRLRFASIASAAVAAVSGTAGSAAAAAPSPVAPPSTVLLQTVDPEQLESALGELTDICPELGDLARACVQQHSDLTFPAVARALEQCVIPALTGADGLPRGLRRNPLSVKVYGGGGSTRVVGSSRRLRSAGEGGPGPVGGPDPLELRSVSSTCARALSALACRRSGSITQPTHLRGVRVNHHAAAADDLLFDIFPPKVARALQAGETVQPERYECVSIFFSDVVGYTDLCSQLQPGEVMDLVHRLYSRFDDLIRELRLFKVETVGDAYLAVSNLRWPQPDDHARLMAQFAFSAVRAANSLPVHPDRPELGTVHIRVGLHCGPVVGSVVGTLNRRYCLFGDAVNTAARMEHNSKADRINCSAAFAGLLREQWPAGAQAVSRGILQVKGKGPMETFWVEEKEAPRAATPSGEKAAATRAVDFGDEAV